jgi:hypothetical protein
MIASWPSYQVDMQGAGNLRPHPHFLLQWIPQAMQAWSDCKVTSLLLLEMTRSYDNVSTEWLLHKLLKRRAAADA